MATNPTTSNKSIREAADEQAGLGTGLPHRHAGTDDVAANQRDQERVGEQAGVIAA